MSGPILSVNIRRCLQQFIKCKHSQVPAAVVPQAIQKFVTDRYPDAKIISLEKDRYSYEVKLNNRWEIKFDTKFNVIDMDSDD